MKGRPSGMAWTVFRVLLIALAAIRLGAPHARAAGPNDTKVDLDELKTRLMAALNQNLGEHDEIVPPEATEPTNPRRPAATQPVEGEPEGEQADADALLVPPDIQVSAEGRVEMHVRNLDLGSVLQMLSMQARRNIVASKKVNGTVTANLYNVTFTEALTAILDSNNATWREQGSFIYVYTRDELAALDASKSPPVTRVFRLHYVSAADVMAVITPMLSKDGSARTGGGGGGGGNGGEGGGKGGPMLSAAKVGLTTSKEEAGGDSNTQDDCLVLTDYPSRLDEIAKVIAEIDTRPKQVLIEATILRALLNEDNALGIDFNLVGGVDFTMLGGTSAAGNDLTLGSVPSRELKNSVYTLNTDFRAAVPDGGFTFGFIKNDIALFIRALEQVTDTTVLANPKVLTLNKQRGEVIVGRRDGYLTTTVTQTAAVQSVEFIETGTRLIFRPFVGDDGYIRMEVHPEDSTGGVTASNLPYEQTTEVTTNIMVRDGHTVLIGGLFRELTTSAKEQLPVVGNVPIAGALFRNSRDTTQREEIIILLTVHLVKDDQALYEASADAIQDVERLRVGMRQGLQCFGRERLAQAHYRWALEHLQKGHLSRALWDLDLAINNNPKFIAAIKLKEELLCKREWDEDSSALRGFVIHQIQREQGRAEPIFGRPSPLAVPQELHGPNGFDEPPEASPTAEAPVGPVPPQPDDSAAAAAKGDLQ